MYTIGNSQKTKNTGLRTITTDCRPPHHPQGHKNVQPELKHRVGKHWKIAAHPRVLNCACCILNGALPTTVCPRCLRNEETKAHLLKNYEFAQVFQFHYLMSLRTGDSLDVHMASWICSTLEKLDLDLCGLFCFSLLEPWRA
ncbi:hypothetical protein PIB30_079907 [Stylosanthes scabra]|uniref:Uncharacterized protein n=1 Tax=Stylosanthes scabra TaxID=79078 RepID=A0ABU6VTW1_9FABA|nr:hypothetical protein [Stylosanthes scabra]